MKKRIWFALALVMILSSFKAMAQEFDYDHTEGKLQAAALNNIEYLYEGSLAKTREIIQIGEAIGQQMEDSKGLLKFIGQQETFATEVVHEMLALKQKTERLDVDVYAVAGEMSILASKIDRLHKETKEMVDNILKQSK